MRPSAVIIVVFKRQRNLRNSANLSNIPEGVRILLSVE
ncbi:hypothetical protein PSE_p0183 (plasmid) [Pseudovibrio sp. FO-BEG1]|nr:hypothetical protein PSE_p0183 [Pseudovibrio sp. FO-BEG1]